MSAVAATVGPWLAVMLTASAVVLAISVLSARSLFVMSISFGATAALGAGALLALGGGDGALNLVLAGAGLAPIILLAGVLLSARAAKAQHRGVLWLSLAAVALAIAAVASIAPELMNARAALRQFAEPTSGVWLAALMFVATIGAVALLGYDERGALEQQGRAQ